MRRIIRNLLGANEHVKNRDEDGSVRAGTAARAKTATRGATTPGEPRYSIDEAELAGAALTQAPPGSQNWCELAGRAGVAWANTGQFDAATTLARELAEAAIPTQARPAWLDAAIKLGYHLLLLERESDARWLAQKAASMIELLGNEMSGSPLPLLAAALPHVRTEPATALAMIEHCTVEETHAALTPTLSCVVHGMIGHLGATIGQHDLAKQHLSAAMAGAGPLGLGLISHRAGQTLAVRLAWEGAHPIAETYARDAWEWFAVRKDARLTALAHHCLAEVLRHQGDLDGAESEARAAESSLPRGNALQAGFLASLARVLGRQGKVGESLAVAERAIRCLGSAMKSLHSIGGFASELPIYLAHALALEASAEVTRAYQQIDSARTRLLDYARRIPEYWRRAFLEDIPDHKYIKEMYAKLERISIPLALTVTPQDDISGGTTMEFEVSDVPTHAADPSSTTSAPTASVDDDRVITFPFTAPVRSLPKKATPGQTPPATTLGELLEAVHSGRITLHRPVLIDCGAGSWEPGHGKTNAFTVRVEGKTTIVMRSPSISKEPRLQAERGQFVDRVLLLGSNTPMDDQQSVTIGRSRRCDVRIDNDTVSQVHGSIGFDATNGEYYVVDENSRNHTYLDGKQLLPTIRTPIRSSARVCFGSAEFLFFDPEALQTLITSTS